MGRPSQLQCTPSCFHIFSCLNSQEYFKTALHGKAQTKQYIGNILLAISLLNTQTCLYNNPLKREKLPLRIVVKVNER